MVGHIQKFVKYIVVAVSLCHIRHVIFCLVKIQFANTIYYETANLLIDFFLFFSALGAEGSDSWRGFLLSYSDESP